MSAYSVEELERVGKAILDEGKNFGALAHHLKGNERLETRLARAALNAMRPRKPQINVRQLIEEIDSGKRDGFLNRGENLHGNDADLACPYCGGSGHIDDVARTSQDKGEPTNG